jgi:hypothetical protein
MGLLAIGLLAGVVPYRDRVTLELSGQGSAHAAASCHSPFRGAFEARSAGGWIGYSPDEPDIVLPAEWCDPARARRRLAFGAFLAVGGAGLLVLDRRRSSRPEPPPADAP